MAKADINKPVPADPPEQTVEQKWTEVQDRGWKVQEAGIEKCSFYPFADMFIELYPDDHPFIEESFAVQPNHHKGDTTPTEFTNPYRGKGTLIGFGRFCMRFLLDEKGLEDHIDHLQEILDAVKFINSKPDIINEDVPTLLPMDREAYLPAHKKHTRQEDARELAGATAERIRERQSNGSSG